MVQDILYIYQINTYLGPPDMVIYNTKRNFISIKFKQLANSMAIKIKEVLVEAYNSVGLVKRYYTPLQYMYKIIQNELKGEYINKEMILQMAVKAVNNLVGLNGIIPTLLVFSVYL